MFSFVHRVVSSHLIFRPLCRGQIRPDMKFFSVSHLTPSHVSTCFVCFGSAFYYVGSVHFSCRGSLSRHSPLVSLWYVMACHVMSRLLLSCCLHACARSIMPCHLLSCLVVSDGCPPPIPVDVGPLIFVMPSRTAPVQPPFPPHSPLKPTSSLLIAISGDDACTEVVVPNSDAIALC